MIISRTPLRISFAGGGSDFKEYYRQYGGCVLSASINKYVYLSMHPYFHQDKFLLKYSQTEHADTVDDIRHNLIREVFREYKINGVDFNSNADIPSGGTGLGSSSAFTASLITLCNAYNGTYLTKEQVANLACKIEIDRLREPIGKQDQYACAIGGMNFLSFNTDDTVSIEKINLPNKNQTVLQNRLMMFYTGITRSATTILSTQRHNIINDHTKIQKLRRMTELTGILKNELNSGNMDVMGNILHEGWMLKKEMAAEITTSDLDTIYNTAIKNGAEGGKILGAGGGGFFLFYVKEENQERLTANLPGMKKFNFEFEQIGTTIIYSD